MGAFFQAFCSCLFISVKVRVPRRTVASCCILALFHRDVEDSLAVTLSSSVSLYKKKITVLAFSVLQLLVQLHFCFHPVFISSSLFPKVNDAVYSSSSSSFIPHESLSFNFFFFFIIWNLCFRFFFV